MNNYLIENYNKRQIDIIESTDRLYMQSKSKWFIFPFVAANGVIDLTNTSYKADDYNINDAASFERIFMGNESIMYTWVDSTSITIKNQGDQFHTKKFKVGKYFKGVKVDGGYDTNFDGKQGDFTKEQTSETHTIIVCGETITYKDNYNMYVIKNIENKNISDISSDISKQSSDNQLFYISSVSNVMGVDNGNKILYQIITFSSLNERLQQSGQSALKTMLFGHIGAGYAWPTIVDKKLQLDTAKLQNVGVKTVNMNAYGNNAPSSWNLFGYPILQNKEVILNDDGTYEDKMYNIRPLNFDLTGTKLTSQAPTQSGVLQGMPDKLFGQRYTNAQTRLMYLEGEPTGYIHISSFLDMLKAKFNLLMKYEFTGILDFSGTPLATSNPDDQVFWDDKITFKRQSTKININNNPYYVLPNSIVPSKLIFNSKGISSDGNVGNEILTLLPNIEMKFVNMINNNSYLNRQLVLMNLSIKEVLAFAASDFPIIGEFLNRIFFGIPLGMSLVKDTINMPILNVICTFMAKIIVEGVSSVWGDTNANLMALNVFDEDSQLANALGATSASMAYMCELTDKISLELVKVAEDGTVSVADSTVNTTTMMVGQLLYSDQDSDNPFWSTSLGGAQQATVLTDYVVYVDSGTPLNGDVSQWYPTANGGDEDGEHEIAYVITGIETTFLSKTEFVFSFLSRNPYKDNLTNYVWEDYLIATVVYTSQAKYVGNTLAVKSYYTVASYPFDNPDKNTFTFPRPIVPNIPQPYAADITLLLGNTYSDSQNRTVSKVQGYPLLNHYTFIENNDVNLFYKCDLIKSIDIVNDINSIPIQNFQDILNNYAIININYKIKISQSLNGTSGLYNPQLNQWDYETSINGSEFDFNLVDNDGVNISTDGEATYKITINTSSLTDTDTTADAPTIGDFNSDINNTTIADTSDQGITQQIIEEQDNANLGLTLDNINEVIKTNDLSRSGPRNTFYTYQLNAASVSNGKELKTYRIQPIQASTDIKVGPNIYTMTSNNANNVQLKDMFSLWFINNKSQNKIDIYAKFSNTFMNHIGYEVRNNQAIFFNQNINLDTEITITSIEFKKLK